MKKRFSIFMLLLVVVVGTVFLLTSCGGNTTSKPKSGEANTVEASVDINYDAKYYTDGGFINLKGKAPELMEITGYQGNVKELNLKKIEEKVKIDGKKINVVSVNGFYNCDTLETVDLSKKEVTDGLNIDNAYDRELETVVGAFQDCDNLTTVVLPNNLYTSDNVIAERAFMDCKKLTSITGLDKFSTILDEAFSNCESLTTVALSPELEDISENLFSNCFKLTTVTLGTKIKYINPFAFVNTKVTNIDFKAMTELEIIGSGAFYNANLTKVELPDGIKSVEFGAFLNNELTLVDIPFISELGDVDTSYNDIFGFEDYYLEVKKGMKDEDITENRINYLPKTTVKVRKSNQLLNNNFSNDIYGGMMSNIVSVDLTYVANGMYDFNFDGESTDKIEIPESALTIAPSVYDGQINLTSFKVNGVEQFTPAD